MEKEQTKKPWESPQVIEIEIKMTQLGGGIGYDWLNEEEYAMDMGS